MTEVNHSQRPCIASAGVILASSDPRSVLSVIQLSKASYRRMQQTFGGQPDTT
jgi:cation transport ATPase